MTEFTPLLSLTGGMLIGLASVMLMALHGRIAGMTGILTGLLPPATGDWSWRAAFLVGAIAAPALLLGFSAGGIDFASPVPTPWLIVGGLLVGIGAFFGSGCTSGHGVCGIARLSPRSIAATGVFMGAATLTVFIVRHVLGGL